MIRTQRAHLNVEAHTHPGMTGKNNEDRYAVASFMASAQDRTPVLFAVLADGIGSVTTARDVTPEELGAALREIGCN